MDETPGKLTHQSYDYQQILFADRCKASELINCLLLHTAASSI